jgi:hypothetical protein
MLAGSRASRAGSPCVEKIGGRDRPAAGEAGTVVDGADVSDGADVVAGAAVTAGALDPLPGANGEEGAGRPADDPGDAGDAGPPQATANEITTAAKAPIPKTCFKSRVLPVRHRNPDRCVAAKTHGGRGDRALRQPGSTRTVPPDENATRSSTADRGVSLRG